MRDILVICFDFVSTMDVVDTSPGATVLLRTVAKVEVISDTRTLAEPTVVNLFVTNRNVVDETESTLLIGGRDSVCVSLEWRVVEEVRMGRGVKGRKLEHPLALRMIEGGRVFRRREIFGMSGVMREVNEGGDWCRALAGSLAP